MTAILIVLYIYRCWVAVMFVAGQLHLSSKLRHVYEWRKGSTPSMDHSGAREICMTHQTRLAS